MRIDIINGPNLNLLGKREPEIYGKQTFDEYLADLRRSFPDVEIFYFQTNHEGSIIDKIQEVGFTTNGIVLNAGGYSHTSIAIRDAISAVTAPTVEVHISDIYQREAFRHISLLTEVCLSAHIGEGIVGYAHAIDDLIEYDTKKKTEKKN